MHESGVSTSNGGAGIPPAILKSVARWKDRRQDACATARCVVPLSRLFQTMNRAELLQEQVKWVLLGLTGVEDFWNENHIGNRLHGHSDFGAYSANSPAGNRPL